MVANPTNPPVLSPLLEIVISSSIFSVQLTALVLAIAPTNPPILFSPLTSSVLLLIEHDNNKLSGLKLDH